LTLVIFVPSMSLETMIGRELEPGY
jgi:hypothetical protein